MRDIETIDFQGYPRLLKRNQSDSSGRIPACAHDEEMIMREVESVRSKLDHRSSASNSDRFDLDTIQESSPRWWPAAPGAQLAALRRWHP